MGKHAHALARANEDRHLVDLSVDEAKLMITGLQEAIVEKDSHISELEEDMREKDYEIGQLQATVRQLLGPKPPDHHYGWVIVLCTFTLQFTVLGGINSYSVFLDDLEAEPDLGNPSLSQASVIVSVANGLTPVVGLFAGKVCDRWGPRPVLTTAGVMLGVGLLLASYARTYFELLLAFGILLGIAGGCTISPGIAAVSGWFDARRGLAFGVAYSGSGLGTTLCPILAHFLLANFDWRDSFKYMSLLSIPAVLAGLVMDRRTPYVAPHEDHHLKLKHIVTNKIIVTLFFVGICFAYGFFFVVVYTYSYSQDFGKHPYASREVISKSSSTLLLSIFGAAQTVGNIAWGEIARRFGNFFAFKLAHAVCGLLMLAWPFCQWFWSMVVFSVLIGFFVAGCLTCYPGVAADHFAGPQLGSIVAVIYLGFGTGSLTGPPLCGVLISAFDGDYMVACFSASLMFFVALGLVHFLIPLPASLDRTIAETLSATERHIEPTSKPPLMIHDAKTPPSSASCGASMQASMATFNRFSESQPGCGIDIGGRDSLDTPQPEAGRRPVSTSSSAKAGEGRRLLSQSPAQQYGE